MKRLFCIVVVLGMLPLSGCASNRVAIQPILAPTQTPAVDSAYVAGMFSRKWDSSLTSFGLGILNTKTAEEYVLPFGPENTLPTNVSDELDLIRIPPGEYRVAYWIRYSIKERSWLSKTEFTPDSLTSKTFTLAPGEVIFLGSFVPEAAGKDAEGKAVWVMHHWRTSQRATQNALNRSYPKFMAQPLICPSCME